MRFLRDLARRRIVRGAGLAVAAVLLAWAIDTTWRNRSYPDEKLSIDGIDNFGRVHTKLYRGGQPSSEGLVALKKLGVDTIISFTLGEEGAKVEAAEAERLGMTYMPLPWSTVEVPEPEQVDAFLNYLKSNPEKTVFVHCKAGADRTGTMIALSRIALDGWPSARAIDEMNAFHYHFIFLPHLQRFVEHFAPTAAH